MLIFTPLFICIFFFFNDTATTEIYTLSLHDALPILGWSEIISIPNPSLLCMTLTERMTATAPGEGDGRSDCAAPGLAMRTAETSDSMRSWVTMRGTDLDRKSTRLNSSHGYISYAVFCLKKKKTDPQRQLEV